MIKKWVQSIWNPAPIIILLPNISPTHASVTAPLRVYAGDKIPNHKTHNMSNVCQLIYWWYTGKMNTISLIDGTILIHVRKVMGSSYNWFVRISYPKHTLHHLDLKHLQSTNKWTLPCLIKPLRWVFFFFKLYTRVHNNWRMVNF